MKKSVKNERGLSPVVASTLMILLVLVLAAIIFLWARGFLGEQIEKFGNPIEQSCSSVDFKAELNGEQLEIINRGDIDIRHLDIKLTDFDGNSEVRRFDFSVDAGGEGVTKEIRLKINDKDPIETIIYPALIGNIKGKSSNKVFTCMDVGVVL